MMNNYYTPPPNLKTFLLVHVMQQCNRVSTFHRATRFRLSLFFTKLSDRVKKLSLQLNFLNLRILKCEQ